MARTRTTIRRIDPWSILKFAFVANLVLLGIELLAGAVVWYVIQRLELIQTVCELAATVGFEECGVDGGALFDTVLVLGLLGVVIQTGILVFLTFLANLIFDLTGGIVVTLEDDRAPTGAGRNRSGIGSRSATDSSSAGASFSGAAAGSASGRDGSGSGRGSDATSTQRSGSGTTTATSSGPDGSPPVPPVGRDGSGSDTTSTTSNDTSTDGSGSSTDTSDSDAGSTGWGGGRDDDTLFGGS